MVDFGALVAMQSSNKLPEKVTSMSTSKVFNDYLQEMSVVQMNEGEARIATCGDHSLKILQVDQAGLEVLTEVPLGRNFTVGEFLDQVEWDSDGQGLAVSSTDGYLYVHELAENKA